MQAIGHRRLELHLRVDPPRVRLRLGATSHFQPLQTIPTELQKLVDKQASLAYIGTESPDEHRRWTPLDEQTGPEAASGREDLRFEETCAMSLQRFVPEPKLAEYRERFKHQFRLERRAEGVILARGQT